MISEEFVENVINTYPFKNKVAFDIGAHHGKFTQILLEKFDKVYAFEPFPENIKVLKEKFADNPKVVIIEKAVHRKIGKEKLFLNGETTQGSVSKVFAQVGAWNYSPEKFIEVETITLDEFCLFNKIFNIGLIKIDVEGAEHYVFHGADFLLEYLDNESWMILESHQLVDYDLISEKLEKYGFKFVNTELETVDELEPCNHYIIHKSDIIFKRKPDD
jgi:FkbM family methyltransferase